MITTAYEFDGLEATQPGLDELLLRDREMRWAPLPPPPASWGPPEKKEAALRQAAPNETELTEKTISRPGEIVKDSEKFFAISEEQKAVANGIVDSQDEAFQGYLMSAIVHDREFCDIVAPVLCQLNGEDLEDFSVKSYNGLYAALRDYRTLLGTTAGVGIPESGFLAATLNGYAGQAKFLDFDQVPQAVAVFEEIVRTPFKSAIGTLVRAGWRRWLEKRRVKFAAIRHFGMDDWDVSMLMDKIAAIRAASGGDEPFFDISTAWKNGITQTLPTIAKLDGKTPMLYAWAMNVFFGPPAAGKTLVATLAMYSAIKEGHDVLFLDFENGHKTILFRFASLGCDMEMVLQKLRYYEFPSDSQVKAAQTWAAKHNPGLVVIDSVPKSMGADGLNEDLAADFLKWSTNRVQPFLTTGAAVLLLDHITKNGNGNGGYARGSGSKKGDVGGLMLEFEVGEPFAPKTPTHPGKAGYAKLGVRKDREGGVGAEGTSFGMVKFSPVAVGQTRWEFVPEGADWRINTAHVQILEVVQNDPGCTRTRVREMIREAGRSIANNLAARLVGELREHGYLREEKVKQGYKLYITADGKEALE